MRRSGLCRQLDPRRTSPRSAPPICSPAARSTCATRGSPWSSRGSPGPRLPGRAARPHPRCPACCSLMLAAASRARDRAMPLVGFGAALRRSKLVALTLGDVTTVPGRDLQVLAGARRPTSTARARRSRSGPIRRRRGSAPSPRSTLGACTAAPHPISTEPPAQGRAPNDCCSAPSPRPAGAPAHNSPTRRSPAWSSRPRWTPGSIRNATPAIRCARRPRRADAPDPPQIHRGRARLRRPPICGAIM